MILNPIAKLSSITEATSWFASAELRICGRPQQIASTCSFLPDLVQAARLWDGAATLTTDVLLELNTSEAQRDFSR
jgi:hypothetical protein